MKSKLCVFLGFLFAASAFASPMTIDTIYNGRAVMPLPSSSTASGQIQTTNSTGSLKNKTFDNSSNVDLVLNGIYDVSVQGGDTSTDYLLGALPKNAIITSAFINVITAPTVLFSTPTIGISSKNPQDILVDSALNTFAPVSFYQARPYGTTASFIKLTSATSVYINLKGGSLTAGKLAVFVRYVISQ